MVIEFEPYPMQDRLTMFSPCRQYRYTLWREWDMLNPKYAMFVGLNPSTADETQDDPTIRRCVGFAKAWGYGALCMTNLFAFRATDPKVMKAASDPIGPDNDEWLKRMAAGASVIVAAWGTHGCLGHRNIVVMDLLPGLMCLGKTKDDYPRHPLYLPKGLQPIPLREEKS